MKLGFGTEKEYDDFCKYLAELYLDNKKTTLQSICSYVQEEHGIKLYRQKLYNIFKEYNVEMRDNATAKNKRRTRALRITVDYEDWQYVNDVTDDFEGKHMKREFSIFSLHLVRGKPSKHMILWLDEFKPVVFLYDPKLLKYYVLGEDLSKIEIDVLEELLAQVEEDNDLEPIKAFAREKGLMYWGGHK